MDQRYFQWIAGERRGEVVVFEEIVEEDGMGFICFKDESRVNTELIAEINQTSLTGKMVAEVENPTNIWKFKEKKFTGDEKRVEQDWESQVKYDIPSVEDIMLDGGTPVNKKKVTTLIPPRQTMNKFGKIASSNDLAASYNKSIINKRKVEQTTPEKSVVNVSVPDKPVVNINDPVYIMMDKAKKVDTDVPMVLTVSLPSKALFDVAVDSFDEGGPKVVEYIISNMDLTEVVESLKGALLKAYNVEELIPDPELPVDYYEPEVIQEPIIADAKAGGGFEELQKEVAETAEKLNSNNE